MTDKQHKTLAIQVTTSHWIKLHQVFRQLPKTVRMHKFSHFITLVLWLGYQEAIRNPSALKRGDILHTLTPAQADKITGLPKPIFIDQDVDASPFELWLNSLAPATKELAIADFMAFKLTADNYRSWPPSTSTLDAFK